MNTSVVTDADLHSYVDGQLSPAKCAEVELYLAAHPDIARRISAYREQNAALQKMFGPVLEEPIPSRFRWQLWMLRAKSWPYQQLVAGIAIAFFSGTAGWFLHGNGQSGLGQSNNAFALQARDESSSANFVHQAAIAHVVYSPDIRRPVEIGADQEDQLVAWLSKRLGSKVNPPKLATIGFELIGGRLLPGESGPVAQFMYNDVTGQRLTLYVSNDQIQNKDTAFKFVKEGPVNVFYWIDGKFGYAISSGIDKGRLAEVAAIIYEQLETKK